MGILNFFTPKNANFFDSFAKATANLVEMSAKFKDMVESSDENNREALIRDIRDLEHIGDEVTHRIFTELSKNFITPFDREDIHYLATTLDDVADFINGTASRISLYKYKYFDDVLVNLAGVLHRQTQELHIAIDSLRNMRNAQRVREAIVRINALENEADSIFELAIARLFSDESNAVELIKRKEVLSILETATDKCEDVANVLESILVKNS